MHEAARPIFRMEALQKELGKSLPSEIRTSIVESRSGNEIVFISAAGELPALFLNKQDEIFKDAVLMSSLHVRTLVDLFSGKGNRTIPTFNYEGNPTNGVTMQRLFHALSHHRYCVFSGGFIYDVFSGKDTPGLPEVFGTKIKSEELLTRVIGFLDGISVIDFVGMLRGRLGGLSIDSKPRDIIFAHQNVYALTEVVRDRLGNERFSPFLNYLLSRFTVGESREIEAAKVQSTVLLERRFKPPRFKMADDLDAKVIEMSITINDKQEKFEFSQQEFFEQLTGTCGNESIVPIEKLRLHVDNLAESG